VSALPLWVPWVAFASVVLPPSVGVLARTLRTEPTGLEEWARGFAPAVVLLVAALWLTVDHVHVAQDELDRATVAATALENGQPGAADPDRLAVLVGDRLHHEVQVADAPDRSGDDDGTSYLEVRVHDRGGPVECVEAQTFDSGTYLSTTPGACATR
jgi:hypothetical protein